MGVEAETELGVSSGSSSYGSLWTRHRISRVRLRSALQLQYIVKETAGTYVSKRDRDGGSQDHTIRTSKAYRWCWCRSPVQRKRFNVHAWRVIAHVAKEGCVYGKWAFDIFSFVSYQITVNHSLRSNEITGDRNLRRRRPEGRAHLRQCTAGGECLAVPIGRAQERRRPAWPATAGMGPRPSHPRALR